MRKSPHDRKQDRQAQRIRAKEDASLGHFWMPARERLPEDWRGSGVLKATKLRAKKWNRVCHSYGPSGMKLDNYGQGGEDLMAYFRIKGFVGGQNRYSRGKQLIGGAGRARGGGGAEGWCHLFLHTQDIHNQKPLPYQQPDGSRAFSLSLSTPAGKLLPVTLLEHPEARSVPRVKWAPLSKYVAIFADIQNPFLGY